MKVNVTGCLSLLEDIQSLLLIWLFRLSHSFGPIFYHCMYSCMFFMYSYCYVCSVLCILFHCVVLCIVYVEMCTVLLPPGVNPIAVNKTYRIISYNIHRMSATGNTFIRNTATEINKKDEM